MERKRMTKGTMLLLLNVKKVFLWHSYMHLLFVINMLMVSHTHIREKNYCCWVPCNNYNYNNWSFMFPAMPCLTVCISAVTDLYLSYLCFICWNAQVYFAHSISQYPEAGYWLSVFSKKKKKKEENKHWRVCGIIFQFEYVNDNTDVAVVFNFNEKLQLI